MTTDDDLLRDLHALLLRDDKRLFVQFLEGLDRRAGRGVGSIQEFLPFIERQLDEFQRSALPGRNPSDRAGSRPHDDSSPAEPTRVGGPAPLPWQREGDQAMPGKEHRLTGRQAGAATNEPAARPQTRGASGAASKFARGAEIRGERKAQSPSGRKYYSPTTVTGGESESPAPPTSGPAKSRSYDDFPGPSGKARLRERTSVDLAVELCRKHEFRRIGTMIERTASTAPAAADKMAKDVLFIVSFIEDANDSVRNPNHNALESIKVALDASSLYYKGIYETWFEGAAAARPDHDEFHAMAEELRAYMASEVRLGRDYLLGDRLYAPEIGSFDSQRHEHERGESPALVLPLRFGVDKGDPDGQAHPAIVRSYVDGLVLEGDRP